MNLKPLLPGHVLVSPLRRVPHITDLRPDEITDLFLTVQKVSRTLKRVYNATALNVAVQDGVAAGQSVPHVHAHIIPRKEGDMDKRGGGDKLYDELEGEEGNVGKHLEEADKGEKGSGGSSKPDNDERKPRSMEEMRKEAEWLAQELKKDNPGIDEEGGRDIVGDIASEARSSIDSV